MSHFNTLTAPERYSKMGFPDNYKVTIQTKYDLGGYGLGDHWINLYIWQETFTRWRKKSKGMSWVLIKQKRFSLSTLWQDEDADTVARAWLFEINRMKNLQKKEGK